MLAPKAGPSQLQNTGISPLSSLSNAQVSEPGYGVENMASHLNPRFLLKLRKESKALEITDFVYSVDEGEREEVISKDPNSDSTFILRTNSSKKERLENVMRSQWASANNRILAELLEKREITSLDEVMAYLLYLCTSTSTRLLPEIYMGVSFAV